MFQGETKITEDVIGALRVSVFQMLSNISGRWVQMFNR